MSNLQNFKFGKYFIYTSCQTDLIVYKNALSKKGTFLAIRRQQKIPDPWPADMFEHCSTYYGIYVQFFSSK